MVLARLFWVGVGYGVLGFDLRVAGCYPASLVYIVCTFMVGILYVGVVWVTVLWWVLGRVHSMLWVHSMW